MKSSYLRCTKFVALAATLPFIYGCGGGAGVGSLVGFLFGGGGISGGEISLLASTGGAAAGLGAGSVGVATLVNPEPASMLLVGSGLVAMGYFKSKTNRRSK